MFRRYKTTSSNTAQKTIRIFAILQLCLAFSLLLWIASKPFMGHLFTIKSEMLLYESVIDQTDYFEKLPAKEQKLILNNYKSLQKGLQKPFAVKFKDMLHLLFFDTPPLTQAWLFFSLLLPIFLLLQIEGASQTCWILFVITLVYSIDNQLYAPLFRYKDEMLYPSEKQIVDQYLAGKLPEKMFEQKKHLIDGWRKYLIVNWANETPSDEQNIFGAQLQKGEFFFHLARIHARNNEEIRVSKQYGYKESPLLLFAYVLWNAFFAFMVRERKTAFAQ